MLRPRCRGSKLLHSIIVLCFLSVGPIYAQDADAPAEPFTADPSSLVGATLDAIVSRFGAPRSVRSLRGPEAWQDDVVFVYEGWDLYWFRDRVWQVGIDHAYGLKAGDERDAVLATLGEPLHRREEALIYQLPSRAWPVRLRVGLDENYRIATMYVYRADF
jgi:hypothetical protein